MLRAMNYKLMKMKIIIIEFGVKLLKKALILRFKAALLWGVILMLIYITLVVELSD